MDGLSYVCAIKNYKSKKKIQRRFLYRFTKLFVSGKADAGGTTEEMTDFLKYRNASLTLKTYETLLKLSEIILPETKLSVSKTIEALANQEIKRQKENYRR